MITSNADKILEKTELLIHCWWECKMVLPLWKEVRQFLAKLNMRLLYDANTALLHIYPREMKTYVHINT